MKRKLLVLTLVTALIATLLVGCGNTEEPAAETEVETVEETVEAEPEVVEDEPTETVAAKPLNLEPVNLEELGLTLAEEATEDEEVETEVEEEKETVKEEKTETNTNVVANNTTTAKNDNTQINEPAPTPEPAPTTNNDNPPTTGNCSTNGHNMISSGGTVALDTYQVGTGQYEQVCVQEAGVEQLYDEMGEPAGVIEHPAVYEQREIMVTRTRQTNEFYDICTICGYTTNHRTEVNEW